MSAASAQCKEPETGLRSVLVRDGARPVWRHTLWVSGSIHEAAIECECLGARPHIEAVHQHWLDNPGAWTPRKNFSS